MGNYKDIFSVVEKLVERDQPFLIIKYGIVFMAMANNTYEVVTLRGSRLHYMPIDRKDAIRAIRKFKLPLLHSTDSRNKIWGDERFRDRYRKVCKKNDY